MSLKEEIIEVHSWIFGEGTADAGPSVIAGLCLTVTVHLYKYWIAGMNFWLAVDKELGVDFVLIVGGMYFYLLWRAPFALRNKDRQKIEELNKFIGSKDIKWEIEEKPDKFNADTWYFRGTVYNGDLAIKSAYILLSDLKKDDATWKGHDMTIQLRRKGGAEGSFDFDNGRTIEFDIARILWNPSKTPSVMEVIGHIGSNSIYTRIGATEIGSTTPGIYSFTLQLFGDHLKRRDCHVEFEIIDELGPIRPHIKNISFDKYPS